MQPTLLSTSSDWRDAWNKNWARPDLKRVRVAVAYCSRHGADEITARWQSSGVSVEFLVSLNDGVTDFEAREKLWQWSQKENVEVRGTFKKSGRFHPKIYVFERAEEIRVMIGSVNLTQSAFYENSEAAIELVLGYDETLWFRLQQQLNEWWQIGQLLQRPEVDVEARVLKLMCEGVLIKVEVQMASLWTFFKDDVFEVGDNRFAQSGAVTIERLNASRLDLISKTRLESIEKLRRQTHKELHSIALSTSAGWFVMRSAYADWKRALERAERELSAQLVPFQRAEGRAAERAAWLQELPAQIERTWKSFHRTDQSPTNAQVQRILALATAAFDKKASQFPETVRFVVSLSPHPFPAILDYAGKTAPMEADLYCGALSQQESELRRWMLTLMEATRSELMESIVGILKPNARAPHKQRLRTRLHQLQSLEDGWSQNALQVLTSLEGTPQDYKRLRDEAIAQLLQAQSWPDETIPIEQVLSEFASFVGWKK